MPPAPNAAETLLALLQHTDGDTLIALLDGQLLLELFEEGRTAAELVAVLGPEAVERAKREAEGRRAAGAAKPAAGPAGMLGAVRDSQLWFTLVALAALLPATLALLDVGVALKLLALGPGPVLAGIAALGALGGAIGAKPPAGRVLGALAGALAAAGMFLGVYLYMVHGPGASRGSVLQLEIVLAALAGGVPGFAIYFLRRRAGAAPP
jgi:hypothetical protein